MHYPPPHHQETEFENAILTVSTFPLATVISVNENKPFLTHLPLIYQADGKLGKLIGHIDKRNPQAAFLKDKNLCTVLFNGPDAYISPSILSTSQLSTWNYIKVHFEGFVTEIKEPEKIKDSIIAMTEMLEAPEQAYVLEKDNPRMEAFVNYISGFEIHITSWEGKFKLSQDKVQEDQDRARQALHQNHQPKMTDYLDQIYRNHKTKS